MYPRLVINLTKFEHNLKTMKKKLTESGITLMLATKGFCALPELGYVAEPYVDYFGDSRLINLSKLPKTKQKALIRIPMPSEASQAVRRAQISLNSELATIQALNAAAEELGIIHKIILMADLGDLREGYFSRESMLDDAEIIKSLKNIEICGIGVNLSCYGAVIPTTPIMERLLGWARDLEDCIGHKLEIISGGNSTSLPLIDQNGMPRGINNLRLGESVICGRDPATGVLYPDMYDDVFSLECEVVELKKKPSLPLGETGFNAFGELPKIIDRGQRIRAILAVGRQDITMESIFPYDESVIILGVSSDHLIVDVTDSETSYAVGDIISFSTAYGSILKSCTSPYVEKSFIRQTVSPLT